MVAPGRLGGDGYLWASLQPVVSLREIGWRCQSELHCSRTATAAVTGIHAILFDLDGTLLHSAPDLVAALNWLRESEGLPALEVGPMSRHVSRGAGGLILAGMPAADEQQMEVWKQLFLTRYAANSYERSRLYDGIPELLDALAEADIPWGIVTNKSSALTTPILRATDLLDSASCVVCGDTLSRSKPDPAPVRWACDQLGVPLHETIFAGDDLRDLQAGRAAGTKTAIVHYGYGAFEIGDDLVADSEQVYHPSDFMRLLGLKNG